MKAEYNIICVILILIVVSTCLVGCEDPPVKSQKITQIDKYGEYNSYVREQLTNDYAGSLPENISTKVTVNNYSYVYNCAVFGDPSFCIILSVTADSDDYFSNEKDRISDISKSKIQTDTNIEYYLINGEKSDFQKYIDDKTSDGYSYNFELVIFNNSNKNIQYLTALQWDGQEKSQHLISIAETITELE